MSDSSRRPPADEAPRSPKGTYDVLPPASARWEALLARFAMLAERFGFGLAHTPIFEEARVFRRGIGEGSEIVGKEMYEFEDRSGRRLALRPEGTASIVRAFVQHRPTVPWRVWYFTPAFRYEQPQAGRNRQHHQVGVEVLGTDDPDIDVEVIALASDFYAQLGLRAVTLKINSMGDAACRPAYLDALRGHLAAHAAELCGEHAPRWEQNPLRVLDCKQPACRAATESAPALTDHLCQPCAEHFARVVDGLDAAGIAWTLDRRLVRGFDYYTRTIFEFASTSLDSANDAIGGGGRYDGLVELLGGPKTSGIGFGSGVERLLLACDAEGTFAVPEQAPEVFVVDVTGGTAARDLVLALRRSGLRAERSYDARSMKAQLKAADRSGAPVALIIGDAEAAAGSVTIRDLRDGTQLTESRAAVLERAGATGRVLLEER